MPHVGLKQTVIDTPLTITIIVKLKLGVAPYILHGTYHVVLYDKLETEKHEGREGRKITPTSFTSS